MRISHAFSLPLSLSLHLSLSFSPWAVKKATRRHIRNAARSISECVASSASDDEEEVEMPQHIEGDDDGDGDGDGDDDMELLSAIADDECDGFTTLSQLNEAQQIVSAAAAGATAIPGATAITVTTTTSAIDKLIDAETGCIENVASSSPKPQAVQHQSSLQNLLASDDSRSQHLSDIDNESFNSIDFDAEITIAGVGDQQTTTAASTAATPTTAPSASTTSVESTDSMPDGTTIGTFFNNLLSHSNAGELFVPMHNFITRNTL